MYKQLINHFININLLLLFSQQCTISHYNRRQITYLNHFSLYFHIITVLEKISHQIIQHILTSVYKLQLQK